MRVINAEMRPWILITGEEKSHYTNKLNNVYQLSIAGNWNDITNSDSREERHGGCIYKCEISEGRAK